MAQLAIVNGKAKATGADLALTSDERHRLGQSSSEIAQAKTAQSAIQKEIDKLYIQLEDNPVYRKIMKLEKKKKLMKKHEREAAIYHSKAVEEITKTSRGMKSLGAFLDELIPDQADEPKSNKKGLKA